MICDKIIAGQLDIQHLCNCDKYNAYIARATDIMTFINNNQLKNSGIIIKSILTKEFRYNRGGDNIGATIYIKLSTYDSAPKENPTEIRQKKNT